MMLLYAKRHPSRHSSNTADQNSKCGMISHPVAPFSSIWYEAPTQQYTKTKKKVKKMNSQLTVMPRRGQPALEGQCTLKSQGSLLSTDSGNPSPPSALHVTIICILILS